MLVRGWGRAALAVGVVLVAVAFLSAAFGLISKLEPMPPSFFSL